MSSSGPIVSSNSHPILFVAEQKFKIQKKIARAALEIVSEPAISCANAYATSPVRLMVYY